MVQNNETSNCYCENNHYTVLCTVDSIEEKVDTLSGELDECVSFQDLEAVQDELNGRQDGLETTVNELADTVDVLESNIGDTIEETIETLGLQLRDQLESQIFHGMDGELDEMRKQHDTMVVRMTDVHKTLAAITTRLVVAEGKVHDMETAEHFAELYPQEDAINEAQLWWNQSEDAINAVVDRCFTGMTDMHGRLDVAAAEQMNTQALVNDIEQNIWRETVWLQSNATDTQRDITRMQQEMRNMEQMHQAELVHQFNRANDIDRQNETNEVFRSVVSDILTLVKMKKEPAELRTGRKRRRAADIKFMTPVRRSARVARTPLQEMEANMIP